MPNAKPEKSELRKTTDTLFIRLSMSPTPCKYRTKISTMQLLEERLRVNILTEAEYITKLTKAMVAVPDSCKQTITNHYVTE